MKTVTAKQLREHLSEYLDRMEAGEEIAVIRHSQIIGQLSPSSNQTRTIQPAPGTAAAFRKTMDRLQPLLLKNRGKTDESKTIKELYHEALDERYGL